MSTATAPNDRRQRARDFLEREFRLFVDQVFPDMDPRSQQMADLRSTFLAGAWAAVRGAKVSPDAARVLGEEIQRIVAHDVLAQSTREQKRENS